MRYAYSCVELYTFIRHIDWPKIKNGDFLYRLLKLATQSLSLFIETLKYGSCSRCRWIFAEC